LTQMLVFGFGLAHCGLGLVTYGLVNISEHWTFDLSVTSPILYHWNTAPITRPHDSRICFFFWPNSYWPQRLSAGLCGLLSITLIHLLVVDSITLALVAQMQLWGSTRCCGHQKNTAHITMYMAEVAGRGSV